MGTDRENEDRYIQRLQVPFEYPVCFTHGVFQNDNPLLEGVFRSAGDEAPHRVMVCIDSGVEAAWPTITEDVTRYLGQRPERCELVRPPEVIPGGESAKNGWNVVQSIMSIAGRSHMCRHSFIIAIGGGSVLDLVGFAASLVHRGLRLIRVPTTVLAQCDGGVGVKNSMDEYGMKNFVGTFAPPHAVLVDYDFLSTLPDRYWYGGIAEAYKVAIIKDADFLDQLCEAAPALRERDPQAIEQVIRRTAILHLEHIRDGGDPFEHGTARPLDFGHWAGHRLEMLSNYRLSHGEAIAIGIALDTTYATAQHMITPAHRDLILDGMERTGLATWSPLLHDRTNGDLSVMKGLTDFQEHLGGQLCITLPDGVGNKREVHEMDRSLIRDAIDFLRKRAEARS